ncbi:MAG: hypothetical protein WC824_14700 [Bacteroidota bacterium]|jgi:hypothetical protein
MTDEGLTIEQVMQETGLRLPQVKRFITSGVLVKTPDKTFLTKESVEQVKRHYMLPPRRKQSSTTPKVHPNAMTARAKRFMKISGLSLPEATAHLMELRLPVDVEKIYMEGLEALMGEQILETVKCKCELPFMTAKGSGGQCPRCLYMKGVAR